MKSTIPTLMLLTATSFGTVPVSFTTGTPAKAADVNANFAALDSAIQKKADQTALSKLGDTVRTKADISIKDSLKARVDTGAFSAFKAKEASDVAGLSTSASLKGIRDTLATKADTNWVNRAIKSQQTGNLDSLVKALGSQLASLTAALQSLQSKESNDSLAIRAKIRDDSTVQAAFALQNLPQGSVIGLLTAPGVDGYLAGTNSTWLLAAGQGKVNGVTVPDLRGVFLRGLELATNVAGSPAGYAMRDPDGVRTIGELQMDAIQSHWHKLQFGSPINSDMWVKDGSTPGNITAGWTYGLSGGLGAQKTYDAAASIVIADPSTGPARTSSETRPKNVSVYWYVKVK